MLNKPIGLLLPLVFAWLISTAAGISLLYSAFRDKSPVPTRGWRKFFREIRFRFYFVTGIVLILWVISGIAWILFT